MVTKSWRLMLIGAAARTLALANLVVIILSACTGTPAPLYPVVATITPVNTPINMPEGSPPEIVVYASDLPRSVIYELDLMDNPASPGGKLLGLPNTGDELDPPPENDPRVTFKVQVQSGVPYRCWIHMKVGAPKGKSQANMVWVQFSDAVDKADNEVLVLRSHSYLTAHGPQQEGWTWVGCNLEGTDSLVYFRVNGEVTVYLQAGMEGVGFDQFVLSPADFLERPPTEAVVEK